MISVGPYDAGPNFIWVFDAAAQRLVIPAASVQRWADEIVIWPVVEASWHRTAIRHGSRNTSGSATRRAAGKDRCRLGDIPTPIPTRAWPARQAGFDTIQPRVNKMSPAQNLVRFRLSAGATKAGTRNCRLWLHPGWRRDLREDLAVVRWNLHRQEVALAAASRFCDQLRARERVGGSVPLRCAKQKLKLDYNIPTVIAQYLAKYKKIEN